MYKKKEENFESGFEKIHVECVWKLFRQSSFLAKHTLSYSGLKLQDALTNQKHNSITTVHGVWVT